MLGIGEEGEREHGERFLLSSYASGALVNGGHDNYQRQGGEKELE